MNLPFHFSRVCLTTTSPEKMVSIVQGKSNLEISFTKGIIMPGRHEDEIIKHFVGSSNLVEHYFCILVS